jgi:methylated-DNA-[protein]-cysteine S-methyltransferase
MTKKIPELLNYFLEDCLQWDNEFSIKSMFWGYAIYKNKKVFSLFIDDIIYFKTWENNVDDYKKNNSQIFIYKKKNGVAWVMNYWELPEKILENREELYIWIEKSLKVKSKTTNSKKSKKDLELDNNILKKLLEIPKWKVTTYKILADFFGVHPRRIASVMKNNKHPDDFPCYKVISHSRKIGWYSWPNWVDSKVELVRQDW